MDSVVHTNNTRPINSSNTNNGRDVARDIPERYMSLDEFGELFHRKLDEAYAKLQSDSEQ